jgi:hypothetical protein
MARVPRGRVRNRHCSYYIHIARSAVGQLGYKLIQQTSDCRDDLIWRCRLGYDRHVRPLLDQHARIACMHHERHAELSQSAANRGAAAIAEVEINHSRRESGMLCRVQPGLDITCGNNGRARIAQSVVDFKRNERLILDDKDQASGKSTI